MSDLLKKEDVLLAIQEFLDELAGKDSQEKFRKTGEFDEDAWRKAYKVKDLYSKIYRLPPVEKDEEKITKAGRRKTAFQIVHLNGWIGEEHTCSKCGKLVPFVEWGEPFCSGCGSKFSNYTDFCRQNSPCEKCLHSFCDYRDGKRIYICDNKKSKNYGELGLKRKASCDDCVIADAYKEENNE